MEKGKGKSKVEGLKSLLESEHVVQFELPQERRELRKELLKDFDWLSTDRVIMDMDFPNDRIFEPLRNNNDNPEKAVDEILEVVDSAIDGYEKVIGTLTIFTGSQAYPDEITDDFGVDWYAVRVGTLELYDIVAELELILKITFWEGYEMDEWNTPTH